MKLDATLGENNVLTVEYDEDARDQLVKAAILSALYSSMDKELIGQLEQEVAVLKEKNRKLRKKLREK